MNAAFYNYTGNIKKVLKKLTNGIGLNGLKLYSEFSEQSPSLILEFNQNIYNCNYAIINGSYYFITDKYLQTGNKMQLLFKKDVLTELLTVNNSRIIDLNVILERSANDYNSYIVDNMQNSQVNYTTYSIAFDTDFVLSGSIIVCAIGGE